MSTLPTYDLEVRAADQRRRLHGSIVEFKGQMRERLDLRKNAREHVRAASLAAGVFSFLIGYGLVGMFTRRPVLVIKARELPKEARRVVVMEREPRSKKRRKAIITEEAA